MSTKTIENLKLFRYYRFIGKQSLIWGGLFWLAIKIKQGNIDLDYKLFVNTYLCAYIFFEVLAYQGDLAREDEVADGLTLQEVTGHYGRSATIRSVIKKTILFAIIPVTLIVIWLLLYIGLL